MTENSTDIVPNGHSFANTVGQTDVEKNASPIAPSQISTPVLLSKKTESNDDYGQKVSVVVPDPSHVDSSRQNGDITMKNASMSMSPKKTENGDVNANRKVIPVIIMDDSDDEPVQQNGDVPTAISAPLASRKKAENSENGEINTATSSHSIYKKRNEKTAGIQQQEVLPVERKDLADTGAVRQNGDITMASSSNSLYKKRYEKAAYVNRQQEVIPVVIKDASENDAVRQNGRIATETKKQGPLTKKKRERETQVKSMQIEDEGDEDDDVMRERRPLTAVNSSEGHATGAEMFASNRPHAWHQELAKKHHETADESTLDRQVCLITYLYHDL